MIDRRETLGSAPNAMIFGPFEAKTSPGNVFHASQDHLDALVDVRQVGNVLGDGPIIVYEQNHAAARVSQIPSRTAKPSPGAPPSCDTGRRATTRCRSTSHSQYRRP